MMSCVRIKELPLMRTIAVIPTCSTTTGKAAWKWPSSRFNIMETASCHHRGGCCDMLDRAS
eukprot:12933448-Prorocentrum_lima.AAC.1